MVDGLEELANTLATWASGKAVTVYLFGSRVRGDHRPDSDVDVYMEWGRLDDATMNWWQHENETEWAALKAKLPGPLKFLEGSDPVGRLVVAAPVVHTAQNVTCVCLPRRK
jgi:predicted nucleotidyltransferase